MARNNEVELGRPVSPLPSEILRAPSKECHICSFFLVILAYVLFIVTSPLSVWFCIIVIPAYENGVWLRLGRPRYHKAVLPGVHLRLPFIDEITKVDMRVRTIDVKPQAILSQDSVTVTVDAVIYIRVVDPVASVLNVHKESYATELLGQTTLRNILGTKSLSEILSQREAIAIQIRDILDIPTDKWGVKVERVEIKDVSLPVSMQRSMAAVAEAEREAHARLIAAESEATASIALKKAADQLANSPAALQLRYLQTLNTISAEKSSTIVFPFPIDMLKMFTSGNQSSANVLESGSSGTGSVSKPSDDHRSRSRRSSRRSNRHKILI